MGLIKKLAESIFNYRIEKFPPLGVYPYKDVAKFIKKDNPIVFDVGANEGQSVLQIKENFISSQIHCFEPNKNAFEKLNNEYKKDAFVVVNNFGLGEANETKQFFENELSDMSSFLELGDKGWGHAKNSKPVIISTLDSYSNENKIEHIDLLKIDTQGFELEVLKGASDFLNNNKIHLVLMEVTFADIYKGLPSFDLLYKFMIDAGFRIVTFYGQHYHNNLISWTDVLFINDKFNEPKKESI